MSILGMLFRVSRPAEAKGLSVVLATLVIALSGAVVIPAFAGSCSTRKTTVGSSYINQQTEQRATATNSGCNGGHKLELKLMEDRTAFPDHQISKNTWDITTQHSYERSVYGCDKENGTFYGEQNGAGGKKKSTYRSFSNCQVK